MSVEIEVSFRLPSALVKERLSHDPAATIAMMRDFRHIDMVAEYYDSPLHELRQRKSTLRRRVENGVPYVAFKAAAPERDENRLLARSIWACQTDEVSVAIGTLMDMGAPRELLEIAQKSGFVSRGRFEYARKNVPLMLPDGTSVEMNLDEGVIITEGKRGELNEVLFKMLYGDPDGFERFINSLEGKYELQRELASKYERALRLIRSR